MVILVYLRITLDLLLVEDHFISGTRKNSTCYFKKQFYPLLIMENL